MYRLVRYKIRGESLGVGSATTSWKLVVYGYRYIDGENEGRSVAVVCTETSIGVRMGRARGV